MRGRSQRTGAFFGALVAGLTGGGVDAFVVLWAGTEAGIVISCALGLAGGGFALAKKTRAAAYLMLAGTAGVVLAAAAYVLLQPVAMGPAFEPYLSPGFLPVTGWHAITLFPVPFLLVGTTLALLSRRVAPPSHKAALMVSDAAVREPGSMVHPFQPTKAHLQDFLEKLTFGR